MRVVVIGPGRIGCGYLAPLFRSAGWEVVLCARKPEVVQRIRAAEDYDVRTVREHAGPVHERFRVRVDDAVSLGSSAFVGAVADADLVCTAVGVRNVDALAEPLVLALAARRSPLDVWLVENGSCAASLSRRLQAAGEAAGLRLPPVALGGAVANVAVAHGSWRNGDRPEFVRDGAHELWVDERRLHHGVPDLPGVRGTPDFGARLREKLYVFNSGHAIAAYLGWLRGWGTIAEAVADPYLRPIVAGCLLESRGALLETYPRLGDDVHGPVAEALARYANPALADPVARVARDPLRKLGPGDRLLGPAQLVRRRRGRIPAYYSLAIAGALLYSRADDEQAARLRAQLEESGVAAVLESACGLAPDDELARSIAAHYRGFIVMPGETLFPPAHHASPVQVL